MMLAACNHQKDEPLILFHHVDYQQWLEEETEIGEDDCHKLKHQNR
jgi:hypothetical protein